MRILVVDDDCPHGESLAELLETRGHEAIHAPNYPDAEWLLQLFRFQVAILDFDMPGMTGPAMAARIVERYPRIRPLIVSARAPEGKRLEELGSLPFLEKPIAAAALLGLLEALEREQVGTSIVLRGVFSPVKKHP